MGPTGNCPFILYNNLQLYLCMCICVFVFACIYAHALTSFIKDARRFNPFNKPRRRRSLDGSEFRNKFTYFFESTIKS
jgi:hypothetical protein